MKLKLFAYNKSPLELDINQVARISGVSQSNIIVIMKTGETHTGYMVTFD